MEIDGPDPLNHARRPDGMAGDTVEGGNMPTKVYGTSDDLIEFDGDLYGEVGCYGTDDRDRGVLVVFSDCTILEVKYGKGDAGIWGIAVINQGELFDHIEYCNDEDAKIHSDVVHFKDGIKWGYAATEWAKVR